MKIKAKWEVSYSTGHVEFSLEDVNCNSEKQWDNLSELEKLSRIQEAIDELSDQPSLILDNYYTT